MHLLLMVTLQQDAVNEWKQKTLFGSRQALLAVERKWKVRWLSVQVQFAAVVVVVREPRAVQLISSTD